MNEWDPALPLNEATLSKVLDQNQDMINTDRTQETHVGAYQINDRHIQMKWKFSRKKLQRYKNTEDKSTVVSGPRTSDRTDLRLSTAPNQQHPSHFSRTGFFDGANNFY